MVLPSRTGASQVLSGKKSACKAEMEETWVQSLGWEDPLEKEMAAHSCILTGRIPRTEEPGRLQYMESQSRTQQLSN